MPDSAPILVHLRWHFQFASDVIAGLVASEGSPLLEIITINADAALNPVEVNRLRPKAIIGDSHYRNTLEICGQLQIPFIDLTGSAAQPHCHQILPDDFAIGRMGADFLREAGYVSFACVGFSDQAYSARRMHAFKTSIGEGTIAEFTSALAPNTIGVREPELEAFLESLPVPCGIFTCSDLRAMAVMASLRRLGRKIPEEFCVLGVDVDLILRRISGFLLPSIDQAAWFQGWQAGQLVRKLLKTPGASAKTLHMPPIQVVEPLPVRNGLRVHPKVELLLEALDEFYMLPDGLTIALNKVPLSRRSIEYYTRRILGATPLELLHRRRRRAALSFLADPQMSIAEVAQRSGFTFQGDFSRFIRNEMGVPPSVIRKCLTRQVL